MDERDEWIFIAGVYLEPLLDNLDELEQRLSGLPLYTELAETITDTLDLMNDSTAFWLDSTGDYREGAATTCMGIWQRFDAIFQEAEYRDANALAATIRWIAPPESDANDSALVATYALVLAIEGLRVLYDWQIELQRALVGIAQPSLTDDASSLSRQQMNKARTSMSFHEIDARVQHAEYLGQARQALFVAGMYRQIENIALSADGYRLADQIRAAINAPTIARAKEAGLGNKRPGSLKQVATEQLRERIGKAAQRVLENRPGISRKDLVSVLVSQKIASRPTIRKHLDALDMCPQNP